MSIWLCARSASRTGVCRCSEEKRGLSLHPGGLLCHFGSQVKFRAFRSLRSVFQQISSDFLGPYGPLIDLWSLEEKSQ